MSISLCFCRYVCLSACSSVCLCLPECLTVYLSGRSYSHASFLTPVFSLSCGEFPDALVFLRMSNIIELLWVRTDKFYAGKDGRVILSKKSTINSDKRSLKKFIPKRKFS